MLTLLISGCSTKSQNATAIPSEKPTVNSQSVTAETENNGTIKQLSAQELHDLIAQGKELKLIDVSTPGEFREGHIAGSLLGDIQMLRSQPEKYLNQLNISKSDSILLICETGSKSYQVAKVLIGAGFQNVSNLEAGKIGWIRAGLQMVEGES
jgi:rhodanese-related sulfurtransferase